MSPTTHPRILLVEDDPVSRAFLAEAAEALPAQVDQATCIAEARELACRQVYELFLIDANLPDGRGVDLLRDLRLHATTPALAHTAATHRPELDALVEAGFAEVLVKPLGAAQLQHAIRRALHRGGASATSVGPRSPASDWRSPDAVRSVTTTVFACRVGAATACTGGKPPVRDEEAAVAAVNGHRRQAMQLWALFLAELPAQRTAIRHAFAAGDPATLQAQLHRLHGGCGFVGAARLGAAVQALRDAPGAPKAMQAFEYAVADTLAAASANSG
jgi:CheY-like chemotaxis protein/HPt (histidine-containing phosphotransfer) domain-containing protein